MFFVCDFPQWNGIVRVCNNINDNKDEDDYRN